MSTAEERKFYNSTGWRKVRNQAINRALGMCEECKKFGVIRIGQEVHHIKPVRTHPHLRLHIDNLMYVCHDCHSRITASEAKGTLPTCVECGMTAGTCRACLSSPSRGEPS